MVEINPRKLIVTTFVNRTKSLMKEQKFSDQNSYQKPYAMYSRQILTKKMMIQIFGQNRHLCQKVIRDKDGCYIIINGTIDKNV